MDIKVVNSNYIEITADVVRLCNCGQTDCKNTYTEKVTFHLQLIENNGGSDIKYVSGNTIIAPKGSVFEIIADVIIINYKGIRLVRVLPLKNNRFKRIVRY